MKLIEPASNIANEAGAKEVCFAPVARVREVGWIKFKEYLQMGEEEGGVRSVGPVERRWWGQVDERREWRRC